MNKSFIALFFITSLITTNNAVANSAINKLDNPITQGINHLGLTVSNLEKSTQFFTKNIGLESRWWL